MSRRDNILVAWRTQPQPDVDVGTVETVLTRYSPSGFSKGEGNRQGGVVLWGTNSTAKEGAMGFGGQQPYRKPSRWTRAFSALRDIFATPNGFPLTKDLKAHQVWLDSNGVDGTRLVLKGNRQGIDLRGQMLDKADLRGANFRGATLVKTSLKEADVTGATFWDADLTDADLTGIIGLRAPANGTAHPLGGANLSGATLPDEVAKFKALDNVAELSKNAGKLFISLITADAFMQIIVAKTTDQELLTSAGTTKIPILDADIPTTTLFWLGPLVLLVLYVSLHLYLQRLWEMLAGLSAIFPDGTPLTQRSYPWLLNDLVRSGFPFLRKQNPPVALTQGVLFVGMAYLLVPLTLFPFWARYLCRHEWTVTICQCILAGVFVGACLIFFCLERETLQRPDRPNQGWGISTHLNLFTFQGIACGIVFCTFALLLSQNVISYGVPRDRWQGGRRDLGTYSLRRWVPRVLEELGYRPFANFEEAELSAKPDGWQDTDGPERIHKPAHLKNADLRYANLHKAFLVGADLSRAHLDQADLREADLREAYLYATHLEGANLVSANLGGADLVGAHLEEANLEKANLDGASLGGIFWDNRTIWPGGKSGRNDRPVTSNASMIFVPDPKPAPPSSPTVLKVKRNTLKTPRSSGPNPGASAEQPHPTAPSLSREDEEQTKGAASSALRESESDRAGRTG